MFINIPNNYSSMWGELTYEYNCATSTDIVLDIESAESGESLGVKKFYSSTSAKLNVAPMLFESMLPDVGNIEFTTTLSQAEGFPKISLSVGSESCDERVFCYSQQPLSAPAVVTTMPLNRLLRAHEVDLITFIANEGSTIKYILSAVAQAGGAEIELASEEVVASGSAMQISIAADDFIEEYSTLYCTLYCDGDILAKCGYTLGDSLLQTYRVAWISSKGSIEHYSFPAITSRSYLNSGATVRSLRSAYGTAAEVEALSEILSSPKVWRADGDEYREVEVLTKEQQILSEGVLAVAQIEIRENG